MRIRRRAGVGVAVVVGVVAIAQTWGFDAALLALFGVYVVYRWRVAADPGFVALTVIMIGVSLFAYYLLDLGPRNILAFLVFFEVVRHAEKHLKEAAERYFELRNHEPAPAQRVAWRLLDGFLSLYAPPGTTPGEPSEESHDGQKSHVAG